MSPPHWERGHRCHGLWAGRTRLGFVGIQPGRGAARKLGYSWSMDFPVVDSATGWEPTLRGAKRAVQRAYRLALVPD